MADDLGVGKVSSRSVARDYYNCNKKRVEQTRKGGVSFKRKVKMLKRRQNRLIAGEIDEERRCCKKEKL